MKFVKMAVLAASALVASGGVMAAANPDSIHLALDSLLVASSKMSVMNAMRANHGQPPATNAEAKLGAPSTMTTTEISGIVVNRGGVLNVYLSPATGTDHGLVQYIPKLVEGKEKGKKAVEFVCVSPNIPEIAKIAPRCTYQAANQPTGQAPKK